MTTTNKQQLANQKAIDWVKESQRINQMSTMDYNANAQLANNQTNIWYQRMMNDAARVADRSAAEKRRDREADLNLIRQQGQNALQLEQLRSQNERNSARQVVTGTSSSIFPYSSPMTIRTYGVNDYNAVNRDALSDWNANRDRNVMTTYMMEEAKASGDIAKINADANAKSRLQKENSQQQSNLARIQAANQLAIANKSATASKYQAFVDSEARKFAAAQDANARIFSSFNSGGSGFQYWGGGL
jgi:hypothetical protein